MPIPIGIFASFLDTKTMKIKNYITYPLIIMGMCLSYYINGFEGLKTSLLGMFFIFIISINIPGFKINVGDQKLAMGYGSFLGYKYILFFYLIFMLIYTISNVISLVKEKGHRDVIEKLKIELMTLGKYKLETKKKAGSPYLTFSYIASLLYVFIKEGNLV